MFWPLFHAFATVLYEQIAGYCKLILIAENSFRRFEKICWL